MRKLAMALALVWALVALDSAPVAASSGPPYVRNVPLGKMLDGVALNAAAATRTVTLDVGTYKAAGVVCVVDYTYSAATDVTVAFTGQLAGTVTAYGAKMSKAISSGTGTLSVYSEVYAAGASASFALEYNVRAYERVKLLFGGTSADGSDLVDVACTLVAGGG